MTIFDKIKNIPESVQINIVGSLCVITFFLIILSPVIYVAITGNTFSTQKDVSVVPSPKVTLSVRYSGSERWFTDSIEIGKNLTIQSAFGLYVSSEATFNLGTAEKPKPHIDGSKVVVTCDGRKVFEMSVHASSLDTWAFTAYCSGNEYRLSRGVQKDFYDLPTADGTVNQILELRKD